MYQAQLRVRRSIRWKSTVYLLVSGIAVLLSSTSAAIAGVLDDEGRLVRFDRDIAPILRDKCLKCHGPDEAKNDFRVDDVDSMMMYVEAEDLDASSLFTDYLTSDDEDMLMPPIAHGGPLASGELALLRTWIQEGAVWPEDFAIVAAANETSESAQVVDVVVPGDGLLARVWAFQGYLHPAAVHFPIALLSIGGLFVLLGLKWPAIGTQVPLACLWIGAPAAVGTTLMGWSFATEQGYASWNRFDMTTEVFWHRWSAVIITVIAVATAIIAAIAMRRENQNLNKVWKSGLLVSALLVGLVGHQGGELTYGSTFYQRAFDRLWPPIKDAVTIGTAAVEPVQSTPDRIVADVSDDNSIR